MKFVRLRRIFAAALLLVLMECGTLVSCGSGGDFENRYAADAGDILRASDTVVTLTETADDTAAAETEMETSVMETAPEMPVMETEPETSVMETEPETSVMETEPETPVMETEPEMPVMETEPETSVMETEPETSVMETEPETPVMETAPEPETTPLTSGPAITIPQDTTFVCNTSSGKYHLPDCGSVAKIKPENITYLTCAEAEIPVTFAPCNVCLADSAAVRKTQIPAATAGEVSYILNTNTEKFHAPTCKSVKKIKAENYAEFTGTRDEAIAAGYDPCGNCKP